MVEGLQRGLGLGRFGLLSGGGGGAAGPELLTNTTFDTDTAGWTFEGTATDESTAGFLAGLSGGATNLVAFQSIPTEIGETYALEFLRGPQNTGVYVGNSAGNSALLNSGFAIGGAAANFVFTATATATFISIMSFGANQRASMNTISVYTAEEKLTNPDFDVDTTGWIFEGTAANTSTAGNLSGTSGGASNLVAHQSFESVVGRKYRISMVRRGTANTALYVGTSAGSSNISNFGFAVSGTATQVITAVGTTTFVSMMSIGASAPAAATRITAKGR